MSEGEPWANIRGPIYTVIERAHGISPTLLLDSLLMSVSNEKVAL
jgi:hypothetical protein